MCNYLENSHKKIKKTGYGYKLFRVTKKGIRQLRDCKRVYRKIDEDGFINWSDSVSANQGFCFFTNKRDAEFYLVNEHRSSVIKKIKYKGGLGKGTPSGETIALCKAFKILE